MTAARDSVGAGNREIEQEVGQGYINLQVYPLQEISTPKGCRILPNSTMYWGPSAKYTSERHFSFKP